MTLTPGTIWDLLECLKTIMDLHRVFRFHASQDSENLMYLEGFPLVAKLLPLKLNRSFENVHIQSWGPSMQPKPILCHSSAISIQFECSLTAAAVQWTISNGNECSCRVAVVASHVLSPQNCLRKSCTNSKEPVSC